MTLTEEGHDPVSDQVEPPKKGEENAPPKEESTIKKALTTTIVAVLLSPLSVILGFYLGHTLQHPRLKVVDLDQGYNLEPKLLPDVLTKEISSEKLLAVQFRELIGREDVKSGLSCSGWLDGEGLSDQCAAEVQTVARGMRDAIALPPSPFGLRPSAEETKRFAMILARLLTELDRIAADTTEHRDGTMTFTVGIINTGDVDGVVAKAANLQFAAGNLSLYTPKWLVVKAHGFEEVEFSMTAGDSKDKVVLREFQKHVLSHDETPFQLHLSTAEGKVLNTADSEDADVARSHLFR